MYRWQILELIIDDRRSVTDTGDFLGRLKLRFVNLINPDPPIDAKLTSMIRGILEAYSCSNRFYWGHTKSHTRMNSVEYKSYNYQL